KVPQSRPEAIHWVGRACDDDADPFHSRTPPRLSTFLARSDVLVRLQYILGIVLFLKRYESRVVGSVRSPNEFLARFAQLIDVRSIRERPQLVAPARSVRKASDIRRSSHSLSSAPVTLGRHAIQSLPLRR